MYPFKPKSNKKLTPGMYWGIKLSTGRFACGRVVQINPDDTRGLLAGLMDWVGDRPPTDDDLVGRQTLEQGSAHIKAIVECGYNGAILGHRPLELDGVEPWLFKSSVYINPGVSSIQRGFEFIRPAEYEDEDQYEVFSTWGYEVLNLLAEKHFGSVEAYQKSKSSTEDERLNLEYFYGDLAFEVENIFNKSLHQKSGSIEKATQKVKREFAKELNDSDDRPIVYLTLAELQFSNGFVMDEIRKEAIKVMDDGHYLGRWNAAENGQRDEMMERLNTLRQNLLK